MDITPAHPPSGRRRARRCSTLARWAAALVVAGTAGLGLVAPAPAQATPTSSTYLARGDNMTKNQAIIRVNGAATWQLIMQSDGNLVLYYRAWYGTTVCFSTNTQGRGDRAIYTLGGDLTVIDSRGFRLWHSGANTGTTVDISAYGHLYVGYAPMNNTCPAYIGL